MDKLSATEIVKNPFFLHINKILQIIYNDEFTFNNYLSSNYIYVIYQRIFSITKFAFDRDFYDYVEPNFPFFYIQQTFNPIYQNSRTLLDAYNDDFINKNGAINFIKKYPVIPVLIKKAIDDLNNLEQEVKRAVYTDEKLLLEQFNTGRPIGNIVNISYNEGDVHQNGRATTILTFECGLKLVYKPRSGSMDIAFYKFLDCISKETHLRYREVKILDCQKYYWSEYIENLPIDDIRNVGNYYIRCGGLIALCFLLTGSDFHFENIIANGEYPVLIDLECLFGACEEMSKDKYSVYDTSLVPLYMYDGDVDSPVDNSGLGAFGEQFSADRVWKWENLDSDAIRLVSEKSKFLSTKNQPQSLGIAISPKDYLNEIIRGFEIICNWFIINKDKLSKTESIFSIFKNQPIRLVVRNTTDYKAILNNSYNPASLSNGEVRKEFIKDDLNKLYPYIFLDNYRKFPIRESEAEVIEKLNVPLFHTNTMSQSLFESSRLIMEDFYEKKPYEFVLEKIQSFNSEDLYYQISLIKSAFSIRYGIEEDVKPINVHKLKSSQINLAKEIHNIASYIKMVGKRHAGSYIWNSYTNPQNGKLMYSTLGHGLYEGSLGIAYFLAISNILTNNKENEVIYQDIIKNEIRKYELGDSSVDISLSNGIAGLIYVILKTGNSCAHEKALLLSNLINEKTISKDNVFDIMHGSSGLIVVLSLLYKATSSPHVLKLLVFAADHILQHKVRDDNSGLMTWKSSLFKQPILGLSHGSSGISYGLLAAYEVTGNNRYRDAFYEIFKFEDFYKDTSNLNWAERRDSTLNLQNAWCHGASGIGLTRLYAYRLLQDDRVLPDIYMAIDSVIKHPIFGSDTYCCGSTGRIDFLIEASKVLCRPDLKVTAEEMVLRVIEDKYKYGYYNTYEIPRVSPPNPSLFRGIAGIGYVAARIEENTNISCLGVLQ